MALALGGRGGIHPDELLERLTAGQWLDWVRYDRQFHIGPHRDDMHWAIALANFINANLPPGEMPVRWKQCNPYRDEWDYDEDLSREELLAKIGVGSVIGKK